MRLPDLPALLPSPAHGQSGGVYLLIPDPPGGGHDIGATSRLGMTQIARMPDNGGFGHAPIGRRRSAH